MSLHVLANVKAAGLGRDIVKCLLAALGYANDITFPSPNKSDMRTLLGGSAQYVLQRFRH